MRTGERSAGTIVDFGDARQASKRDIDVEFQSTDGRSIIPVTIHAGRLRALAMGGFPPLAGPYKSMLAVSRGAHAVSGQEPDPAWAPVDDAEPGDWDSAAVPRDLPRLAFTGADDQIDYSLQWGGVQVRIGEPLASRCGSVSRWPGTGRNSSPPAGMCRSFPGSTISAP